MRTANWKDYELIDTGSGERLERWGDILLIRPDPQIIWTSDKKDPRWKTGHGHLSHLPHRHRQPLSGHRG